MTLRFAFALLSLILLLNTSSVHKLAVETEHQLFAEVKNDPNYSSRYVFDFDDPPALQPGNINDFPASRQGAHFAQSFDNHADENYPHYCIRAPPQFFFV